MRPTPVARAPQERVDAPAARPRRAALLLAVLLLALLVGATRAPSDTSADDGGAAAPRTASEPAGTPTLAPSPVDAATGGSPYADVVDEPEDTGTAGTTNAAAVDDGVDPVEPVLREGTRARDELAAAVRRIDKSGDEAGAPERSEALQDFGRSFDRLVDEVDSNGLRPRAALRALKRLDAATRDAILASVDDEELATLAERWLDD